MKKISISMLAMTASLCAGNLCANDVLPRPEPTPQPATKGRPTIAVFPAVTTDALRKDIKDASQMDRVVESLNEYVLATITSTRKFTPLARGDAEMDKAIEESGMGKIFDDQPIIKGATYSVFIKLDSFLDNEEKVGNLVKRRLQLAGTVKIYENATTKLLDMSKILKEEVDITQVSAGVNAARLNALLTQITDNFAVDSVERLLSVTFPVKVLNVDDSDITINLGGDFFKVDEIVDIFGPSKTIEDEETGEKISIKGKLIGTATITSVEPNYSQAKINGKVEVTKSAEVRKQQAKKK